MTIIKLGRFSLPKPTKVGVFILALIVFGLITSFILGLKTEYDKSEQKKNKLHYKTIKL
jgi:hypothetical protein